MYDPYSCAISLFENIRYVFNRITVGLMRCETGEPTYIRGSGVILETLPSSDVDDLTNTAKEKHRLVNKELPNTNYVE